MKIDFILDANFLIKLHIAATSIIYNVPLVTADKQFSQIEELDLILIEF